MPADNTRRRGVALVLGAAALWSLNGALIKLTMQTEDAPGGITIAFYRSLFAGLFLLPFAQGRFSWISTTDKPHKLAAALCMIFFTLMTLCFVVATTWTAAASAVILQYTSTFWIFVLSPWLLREKPAASETWLLVAALAGVVVMFLGNRSTETSGLAVALGSGLFFGLLCMMLRKLRDVPSVSLVIINNLGAAALLAPLVLAAGTFALSPRATALLAAMGVIQFGLPYLLFTRGLRYIPAHQAALLTLTEPLLVPVWTYLAVGETVPAATILGGALILLTLVVFLMPKKRKPRKATHEPTVSA